MKLTPMEIRSAIFRDVVNEALDSEEPLLATIFARSLPFTNAIKSRSDVLLIEVRPDNRDRLISELSGRIQAVNRADETFLAGFFSRVFTSVLSRNEAR